MPIPNPGEKETQDDFMARCMGDDVMQEYPQDQRAAICHNSWHESMMKSKGLDTLVFESPEAIKSIEVKDGKATVGAYAIRFSGPEQKDLQGDFFTANTYLGAHKGDGVDVLFNHGQAPTKAFADVCDMVMSAAKATADAVGVFVQHVLDLSNEYEAAIAKLCAAGRLKWSSGATAHMVKRTDTGEIVRWPIAEFSYTPTPAEPRLPAIAPLKSMALSEVETNELKQALLKVEPPKEKETVKPPKDEAIAASDSKPTKTQVDNQTKAEAAKNEKPPEQKISIGKKMDNDPEIQKRIDDEVKARVDEIKIAQEKVDAAVKSRTLEIQEIYAIGDKFGKRGEAAKFVEEGKSVGDFQSYILSRLNPKTFALEPNAVDLKTMRRKDFETLSVGEKRTFLQSGGKLTD